MLRVFERRARSMGLTEIARAADLGRTAAQRFAHTLERLCYRRKDPRSKYYERTVRALARGHHTAPAAMLQSLTRKAGR